MFFSEKSPVVLAFIALAFISSPSAVQAIGLSEAGSVRTDFSFGSVDDRSFDGTGFDLFAEFSEFSSGNVLAFDSFSASGQGGSTLEFTMLSEVCGYCGQNPAFTDSFGLIDSEGDFVSAIDAGHSIVGDTGSIDIAADQEYTLALKSPETIFSSIDADNIDETAHILGTTIEKSGTVQIDNADLFGSTLSFDLMVGDIIIFVEDLIATGNTVSFVPDTSDFDFNDLIFVVRESSKPVPEPSTVLLLAIGGGAFLLNKRKHRS